MPLKSYKELVVWQKSIDLALDVYRLTECFPRDERFGLVAQMRRAGSSVAANIAEGYGRLTRGEYLNQLSVARGSVCEIETLRTIAERLGYAEAEKFETNTVLTDSVGRMLVRLIQKLRQR